VDHRQCPMPQRLSRADGSVNQDSRRRHEHVSVCIGDNPAPQISIGETRTPGLNPRALKSGISMGNSHATAASHDLIPKSPRCALRRLKCCSGWPPQPPMRLINPPCIFFLSVGTIAKSQGDWNRSCSAPNQDYGPTGLVSTCRYVFAFASF